jgi:hypothetical protein
MNISASEVFKRQRVVAPKERLLTDTVKLVALAVANPEHNTFQSEARSPRGCFRIAIVSSGRCRASSIMPESPSVMRRNRCAGNQPHALAASHNGCSEIHNALIVKATIKALDRAGMTAVGAGHYP